tara:strand:- start:21305 stop:21688 length:384 start_codon:yes stop_codon:yes gene_type:complete
MKVLSETVGKDIAAKKGWISMILEKERKEKTARSQAGVPAQQSRPLQETANVNRPSHQRTQSHDVFTQQYSKSVPSSPVKGHSRTQSHAPAPPAKDQRMSQAPPSRPRDAGKSGSSGRREQVRSMIF